MTKHIALIAERFTMTLEQSPDDVEPWYADWAIQHPKRIARSITAGLYAYHSLLSVYAPEEIESAWEAFGGIGAQSHIIRDIFPVTRHVVGECSERAVAHLRETLPPGRLGAVAGRLR